MAATLRATVRVDRTYPETVRYQEVADSPITQIARLAALHDEAAETALLANLLGRMPYLTAGLAAATCAAAFLVHAELAPLLTWLTLLGAGLIAIVRAYVTTIAAPFERTPLRFFGRDLQAILLYVGFAWGAGSFLILSADISLFQALLFSTGAVALVAVITRAFDPIVSFSIPVVALSAAAAATRPFHESVLATAAVLATGLVLVGLSYLWDRWTARPQTHQFAALPTGL